MATNSDQEVRAPNIRATTFLVSIAIRVTKFNFIDNIDCKKYFSNQIKYLLDLRQVETEKSYTTLKTQLSIQNILLGNIAKLI